MLWKQRGQGWLYDKDSTGAAPLRVKRKFQAAKPARVKVQRLESHQGEAGLGQRWEMRLEGGSGSCVPGSHAWRLELYSGGSDDSLKVLK